ncbi:MAG: hypothetical protein NWF05_05245 [Candidatus Bathyarchaeota archaeon]|nr:hypothetical protein [Candidatus Bathyarchaeota archaeon]
MSIRQIDKENSEFYNENVTNIERGKLSIKDILGFEIEGAPVFLPRVPCAHVTPNREICHTAEEGIKSSSIFSLAPVYDSIIYPIEMGYNDRPLTEKSFKELNSVSLDDFLVFVEKKRVIPYFPYKYGRYEQEFVKKFLEPGLPRISSLHLFLLLLKDNCSTVGGDCKVCDGCNERAKADISKFVTGEQSESCLHCLMKIYSSGIKRDFILQQESINTICAIKDILTARNLNAIVKTNCRIAKAALGAFTSSVESSHTIDCVVKGLKVNYSPDIDLESYLDFLDGKTTRAVREIVKKLMEDPYTRKYSERLSARLCELNKEIEEIGKTKAAKFYKAVSDIAVYGGSKYVEAQSGSMTKIPKKEAHRTSEWMASKLLDLHAKATGKDWTLAQISKTRNKIEKCRDMSK